MGVGWSHWGIRIRGYLEHLDHVLTIPLLGNVAQPGSDVNSATDVHVHLHSLLLDLTVKLRQILTDTRGPVTYTVHPSQLRRAEEAPHTKYYKNHHKCISVIIQDMVTFLCSRCFIQREKQAQPVPGAVRVKGLALGTNGEINHKIWSDNHVIAKTVS